jgi:hypothetical protein
MLEIRVLLQEDLRVVRRAAQSSRVDFGLRIAKFCGSPSAPVAQTGADLRACPEEVISTARPAGTREMQFDK